jgi:(p)ppGpp synthase/HD superfamily hydrolase
MNLENVKSFAKKAHEGQTRNDGVTPYFNHIEQVVENTRRLGGDELCLAAAYLHDVIEDTATAYYDLRQIPVPEEVIHAVHSLTKNKGEQYENAIIRAKNNPIARIVKIADNLANLSDEPSRNQVKKYSKSVLELLSDCFSHD